VHFALAGISVKNSFTLACIVGAGLGVLVGSTDAAVAAFSSAIDLSLRLPAVFAKFSPYGDVAGFGGASAGSRYSSSINPGATDWENSRKRPIAVSGQFNAIDFDNGPALRVLSESATINTKRLGSFQIAAAHVRNDGSTSGDFLLLDGDYGHIQWGYRVSTYFAIGANFNYTAFRTRAGMGGALLAQNHSDTFGGRFGALWAPLPHLITGLVVDYSSSPARTDFVDATCLCFVSSNDTTHVTLIRPGFSYEYWKQSSIYFDYQYGYYTNATGTLSTNRLFSGIEQRLLPWLFGRVGVLYDFRGTMSPTFGIGVYPLEGLSIDVAYQDDMLPELRPEFGRSKLYSVSVAWSF
jgi:hypothetical protein